MQQQRIYTVRALRRTVLAAGVAAVLAGGSAPGFAAVPGVGAARPTTSASALKTLFGPGARARDFSASIGLPNLTAGAVIPVTSCADDGGFDTLRHAVLTADSGDTIDLSGATCSKITLQSGAIAVSVEDLTIIGPGAQKLSIDGNNAGRVFNHVGLGELTLNELTVTHGKVTGEMAYGGCIISQGSVTLNRSVVTSCVANGNVKSIGGGVVAYGSFSAFYSTLSANSATTTTGAADDLSAASGAVFARESLGLFASVVSGNVAQAPIGKTYGGGLVGANLSVKYSTISANQAISASDPSGSYSSGGGAVSLYTTTVFGSTIDHNVADVAAALSLRDGDQATTALIKRSTISSNVGTLGIGAISAVTSITIANSTIAFNESGPIVGFGVVFNKTAKLQSTIIADNAPIDVAGGGAIAGSNNLVKSADAATSTLPAGTITLDPKLAPLALNGGSTRTHAIGANSPALNAGANPNNDKHDQRGPEYIRVVGAAADVGAYEFDSDHIFGNGLDPY